MVTCSLYNIMNKRPTVWSGTMQGLTGKILFDPHIGCLSQTISYSGQYCMYDWLSHSVVESYINVVGALWFTVIYPCMFQIPVYQFWHKLGMIATSSIWVVANIFFVTLPGLWSMAWGKGVTRGAGFPSSFENCCKLIVPRCKMVPHFACGDVSHFPSHKVRPAYKVRPWFFCSQPIAAWTSVLVIHLC